MSIAILGNPDPKCPVNLVSQDFAQTSLREYVRANVLQVLQ